jgi:hypothetical protein
MSTWDDSAPIDDEDPAADHFRESGVRSRQLVTILTRLFGYAHAGTIPIERLRETEDDDLAEYVGFEVREATLAVVDDSWQRVLTMGGPLDGWTLATQSQRTTDWYHEWWQLAPRVLSRLGQEGWKISCTVGESGVWHICLLRAGREFHASGEFATAAFAAMEAAAESV